MLNNLDSFLLLPGDEQLAELEYVSIVLELTYRAAEECPYMDIQIRRLENYLNLGYSLMDKEFLC